MGTIENKVCVSGVVEKNNERKLFGLSGGKNIVYRLITLTVALGIWQLAAMSYNSDLLMPPPWKTAKAFYFAVQNPELLANLLLTMKRVGLGFLYALLIGAPLGFAMGYSKTVYKLLDPIINPIRQIPIMAWIPLTIVWFGLGDGPTLFLITMVGVFPILINTIAGVQGISPDYYNAARSMRAGPWSIFIHVIVPASLPSILTGVKIAVGLGWMSVICAEFIATSSGFGYYMVEAQSLMETDLLLALMIIAAVVGYSIDRLLGIINKTLTGWRYVK